MTTSNPAANGRGDLLLVQAASLLWSLQFAFLNPALALLLSNGLGATEGQVGIVLALFNASGFVASLVVPAVADRRRDYLGPMMVSGALALALAGSLAVAGSLPVAAIALVVLGGPAGVGSSLFFAHLNATGRGQSAVMSARAMMSLAWVAGPPLAMLLGRTAGIRSVLVAIAVVSVAGILLVGVLRRRGERPADARPGRASASGLPLGRVSGVVVAFIVLHATNSTMTSMMTLYTTSQLGLDMVWGGVALAVAAFIEIPALLLLGRLSARFRPLPMLLVGGLAGMAFFVSMASVDGLAGLLTAQVLNAWFVATISGVGLTWFMEIIPRPGLASGLFSNTFRLGAVFAGAIISIAGTASGYRGMFLVCAGLVALASLIVLIAGRGPQPVVSSESRDDPE